MMTYCFLHDRLWKWETVGYLVADLLEVGLVLNADRTVFFDKSKPTAFDNHD